MGPDQEGPAGHLHSNKRTHKKHEFISKRAWEEVGEPLISAWIDDSDLFQAAKSHQVEAQQQWRWRQRPPHQ